jgi:hypothetical protein
VAWFGSQKLGLDSPWLCEATLAEILYMELLAAFHQYLAGHWLGYELDRHEYLPM